VLTLTARGVRIAVRVQPRAARDRVVGAHGGALKVQVSAPPVEGEANQALVRVLADWLGVPRRAVTLVRGQSARDKLVEVVSDDPPGLAAAIAARVDIA
jgi:uncharacterized protein (TIGR00251 family)